MKRHVIPEWVQNRTLTKAEKSNSVNAMVTKTMLKSFRRHRIVVRKRLTLARFVAMDLGVSSTMKVA